VAEMETKNQEVGDSRRKALDKLMPTEVTIVLCLVALIYRKTHHKANTRNNYSSVQVCEQYGTH